MTTIRPTASVVRRPAVAPARAATPAPAAAPVKPAALPKASLAQAPVMQPKAQEWTVGRVLKNAGIGAGAFAGGSVATFVADLFFHFGNNGGTAWPGGIYLAAAGLTAAGALALYNHMKKD